MFSAPEGDISVDELIDAIEETAGDDSVLVLQHMGGAKFLVCTRNAGQATRLMVAEGFEVNGARVPVEAVGPPVTYVNVYRYPAFLSDEALSNALAQFGKVKGISFATLATRQTKLNGVRVVKIEMCRPVPNFITIAGHKVMCEYRGMRRVCARCGEVGHMATACTTAYCKRCGTFGHDTEGCSADCKRCGGHHGTRECFRKRSYASAARGFPSLSESASSHSQSSGPASARATNSPRMQVLTSRSASRTTERGSPSGDRDLDSDLTSGSGMGDPSASEGERPGSFDETTTRSTETESSDIETGSAQSSPPKPPPPSASRDDCGNSLTAAEATPESNEQGEALLALSNTPVNVRAPVTSLALEAGTQDPAGDDAPIKSKGYYFLPGDSECDHAAPTSSPASHSARPSRKSDAKTGQMATGLEQRARSRSRIRPDDDKRYLGERAASKEARQRRPGPAGQSSDSDAPPHAKAQKLEKDGVGKGEPPPKPRDASH